MSRDDMELLLLACQLCLGLWHICKLTPVGAIIKGVIGWLLRPLGVSPVYSSLQHCHGRVFKRANCFALEADIPSSQRDIVSCEVNVPCEENTINLDYLGRKYVLERKREHMLHIDQKMCYYITHRIWKKLQNLEQVLRYGLEGPPLARALVTKAVAYRAEAHAVSAEAEARSAEPDAERAESMARSAGAEAERAQAEYAEAKSKAEFAEAEAELAQAVRATAEAKAELAEAEAERVEAEAELAQAERAKVEAAGRVFVVGAEAATARAQAKTRIEAEAKAKALAKASQTEALAKDKVSKTEAFAKDTLTSTRHLASNNAMDISRWTRDLVTLMAESNAMDMLVAEAVSQAEMDMLVAEAESQAEAKAKAKSNSKAAEAEFAVSISPSAATQADESMRAAKTYRAAADDASLAAQAATGNAAKKATLAAAARARIPVLTAAAAHARADASAARSAADARTATDIADTTLFVKGKKEFWKEVIAGGVMTFEEISDALILYNKHVSRRLSNDWLLPVNLSVSEEKLLKIFNFVALFLQTKKVNVHWLIPTALSFISAFLEFNTGLRVWFYTKINRLFCNIMHFICDPLPRLWRRQVYSLGKWVENLAPSNDLLVKVVRGDMCAIISEGAKVQKEDAKLVPWLEKDLISDYGVIEERCRCYPINIIMRCSYVIEHELCEISAPTICVFYVNCKSIEDFRHIVTLVSCVADNCCGSLICYSPNNKVCIRGFEESVISYVNNGLPPIYELKLKNVVVAGRDASD